MTSVPLAFRAFLPQACNFLFSLGISIDPTAPHYYPSLWPREGWRTHSSRSVYSSQYSWLVCFDTYFFYLDTYFLAFMNYVLIYQPTFSNKCWYADTHEVLYTGLNTASGQDHNEQTPVLLTQAFVLTQFDWLITLNLISIGTLTYSIDSYRDLRNQWVRHPLHWTCVYVLYQLQCILNAHRSWVSWTAF